MTATHIDIERRTVVSSSGRARQLEAMFDVPRSEESIMRWGGDIDFDEHPWNVGLIVGPSGCGKTTLLGELFGEPSTYEWGAASVIDDFAEQFDMEEISATCQAVGFNTIPSWLRPYAVLSNGERFRVELARRLLEDDQRIVVDEFTSVVDRQVAQIGAHAVQKYVRRHDRQFVAASCHYDIVDWLQPDWIFEPSVMRLQWRCLQPRPSLECTIAPVTYQAWRIFAPFHYMTAELNKAARCFALFVDDRPTTIIAVLYRPHPKTRSVYGISRGVTLPDWQGLGLIFVLQDRLGGAYAAMGRRLRSYPAHPALIHSTDRNPNWRLVQRPVTFHPKGSTSAISGSWEQGMRPNATFEWCGPAAAIPEIEAFA